MDTGNRADYSFCPMRPSLLVAMTTMLLLLPLPGSVARAQDSAGTPAPEKPFSALSRASPHPALRADLPRKGGGEWNPQTP